MNVTCEMLLHPELLSNEQLLYIIQERQLKIAELQRMPRDQLLELFHDYCVPYGQRKYRDSGRGKVLNQTRRMSPEPTLKLNLMNHNQRKTTHSMNYERVKPPPDLLSGHMKRIKLENKVVPLNTNIFKRKISIDSVSPVNSPPPKKDKKPVTWP